LLGFNDTEYLALVHDLQSRALGGSL
jgi:hypothetical protein